MNRSFSELNTIVRCLNKASKKGRIYGRYIKDIALSTKDGYPQSNSVVNEINIWFKNKSDSDKFLRSMGAKLSKIDDSIPGWTYKKFNYDLILSHKRITTVSFLIYPELPVNYDKLTCYFVNNNIRWKSYGNESIDYIKQSIRDNE